MDSYMESHYHDLNMNNGTQEQPSTGLLRFRSAPTTIFDEVTIQNGYSGLGLGSGSGSGSGLGGLPPQYPKPTMARTSSRSMTRKDGVVVNESRKERNNNSIDRQSSLPAGFFDCLNSNDGYTMITGTGNFRGNGTHIESSSRLPMSNLPQISEFGDENVKETNSKGIYFGNHEEGAGFETGFSFSSWNDSSSETSHSSENGRLAAHPNVLVHHMSLPRTSAEIAAAEKLTQFQDTVPWKVRAKRGCATHPRSIAERQTNTADMLDLAVDYIRNLQDQYKILSNVRARCKCEHLKHSVPNQATQ